MSEIRFVVPLPPSVLRPNRRAAHWATRAKAADEYSLAVYISPWHGPMAPTREWPRYRWAGIPWPSALVTYTWRYAGTAPDIDNIAGALKCLQDTLCVAPPPTKRTRAKRDRWYLGLIENDSGIEATFKREKVSHKKDEGVEVLIERC